METLADNTCMLKVGSRYNYQDLVKQLTENLSYDVEAACENALEKSLSEVVLLISIHQMSNNRIE